MANQSDDQARQQDQAEDPQPVEMEEQGASYSSSYNESTPGEVEANRKSALRKQGNERGEATGKSDS